MIFNSVVHAACTASLQEATSHVLMKLAAESGLCIQLLSAEYIKTSKLVSGKHVNVLSRNDYQ